MLFLIADILLVLGIIALIFAFIKTSMVLFLILTIILAVILATFITITIYHFKIHKKVNEIREERKTLMEAIDKQMENKAEAKEIKIPWITEILNRINAVLLEEIDESKYSKDELFVAKRELLKKKRNALHKIYEEINEREAKLNKQALDINSDKSNIFEENRNISRAYVAVNEGLDSLLYQARELKGQMEDKVNHKIDVPDHLKEVVGKYSKLIEKHLDDLKVLERMMYDKELVANCYDGLDLVEEIQEFQEEVVANFREILENIDDPGLTGDIIIAFGMYVDYSKQYLAALVQKMLLAMNKDKENESSYQKAKKANETALNNANQGLDAIIEKLHYAIKRVDFELYIRDVRELE